MFGHLDILTFGFFPSMVLLSSVFPAEACETVGGDACSVEMYPEVKPTPEAERSPKRTASENIDREYYEYDSPKT